jgi:hypothetical protein
VLSHLLFLPGQYLVKLLNQTRHDASYSRAPLESISGQSNRANSFKTNPSQALLQAKTLCLVTFFSSRVKDLVKLVEYSLNPSQGLHFQQGISQAETAVKGSVKLSVNMFLATETSNEILN